MFVDSPLNESAHISVCLFVCVLFLGGSPANRPADPPGDPPSNPPHGPPGDPPSNTPGDPPLTHIAIWRVLGRCCLCFEHWILGSATIYFFITSETVLEVFVDDC